jgi:late competence protein required for DNA uptake (superfamily II DNA/RNA helicase)
MQESPLQILVSTTKSVKHTHTDTPITLGEYLLHVKQGNEFNGCDLKKQINKVRSIKDQKQRSLEKLKLPSVRVGLYQPKDLRKIQAGTITSLISFDIDHLGNIETINRTKAILSESLCKPVTMFVSPSGDGLKLVYWTNLAKVNSKIGEDDFKRAWDLIASHINKTLEENGLEKVDQAPKNPASSMYASYDQEIWINSNPTQSMIKIEELEGYQEALKKQTPSRNKIPNNGDITKPKPKPIVSYLKPSLNDFNELLAVLPAHRKEKALSAAQVYLETPIGLGKRYNAFFKAISYIARLGLSKEKLIEIMHLLDYDQSRDQSAILQSLNKYGYFDRKTTNQPLQQEPIYQEHLSSLKQANQKIPINRFVSEASCHIIKSIQEHQVTMLMSPTGTGKTRFCLKDLPGSSIQGRIFFAVPLISLREQVSDYLDNKTSQILRDGEALKQYKRLVVLSYEKLASILPQLGKQDLLIIDEVHLFAQHFRSGATSKILSHIKERGTKALLLSATGHEANCVLSKVFSASFNSIQLESKEKKSFNLNVIKTSNILDSVISSCIDKLNNNSKAKILVYKDDIEDLYELDSKLKEKAVSSLILTSDKKDTEDFKKIFNGLAIPKEPEESVILATGVVSVGVSMPFIDHILVAGKIGTASLIQIADRGRGGQSVEMLISTNKRKAKDLVECFNDTYLRAYLEKAKKFVSFENERLTLLGGDDLSPWEIEEYIKATQHTLKTSSAKHTNTPLHGILACSKKGTLIMNVQGVLSNIVSVENNNEASWDYYFSKLKTLYGIEAQVSESTEAKGDKKEKSCVWSVLREMIGSEEVPIERVEEITKSMKISERQRTEIVEEIKRRLSFLSSAGLSSSYALLDVKEWAHFTYMASINKTPMLHPLEIALAEKVRPQTPLFIEDMQELVGSLDLKAVGAEHMKEAILDLNNVGFGKLFRKLFKGRDSKRLSPHTKKQARCLIIEKPLWTQLKEARRGDGEAIEEIVG